MMDIEKWNVGNFVKLLVVSLYVIVVSYYNIDLESLGVNVMDRDLDMDEYCLFLGKVKFCFICW